MATYIKSSAAGLSKRTRNLLSSPPTLLSINSSTASISSFLASQRRRELRLRGDVRAGPGQTATSWCGSPVRVAGSGSWRTRRTGSSASCSRRSVGTCRRRPGCARRSSGAPRSGSRSCSATRWATCARNDADAHFREPPPGVHRVLAPLLRPDLKAFETVGEAGAQALEADMLDLIARSTARRTGRWWCQRVPRSRDHEMIALGFFIAVFVALGLVGRAAILWASTAGRICPTRVGRTTRSASSDGRRGADRQHQARCVRGRPG